jgi:CBS domain-containing protein
MLKAGHAPEAVTAFVTGVNDLVTARVIELSGLGAALAEAGGCWIVLGSAGRGEQTLATDQDNAIVFADGSGADARRRALLPLAQRVNAALDQCGYPLCRGEVMAGNPRWCLSRAEWRERFAAWIDRPEPEALLNAAIFFDFRAVYGEAGPVAALREWLAAYARERGRFDLKVNGVQLFVEPARIYALADGVTATTTVERLVGAAQARAIHSADRDAWTRSFRTLQELRLVLNAVQHERGEPLHNHLDPATLTDGERRRLRDALRQARNLQSRLARDFSVAGTGFGA